MAMIYCRYEPGDYPDTEFYQAENGQLVHKRGSLHYVNGVPVNPPPDPSLPIRIQTLLEQSRRDASVMSDGDIQELLDNI
jgi:hypothetical protein